jgi:hypothetical protein
MPNGIETDERLRGRIIFVWLTALCAPASLVHNVGRGLLFDHSRSRAQTSQR